MIAQRAVMVEPPEVTSRLWNPRERAVTPQPGDVYVVVDEQEEGALVLGVARWPELDQLGRLVFPDGAAVDVSVAQSDFERAIATARARRSRSVRIGDVFHVRGLSARSERELAGELKRRPLVEWGTFTDITRDAREAAKAALLAAAPKLTPRQASAIEAPPPDKPDEPPASTTVAGPVV